MTQEIADKLKQIIHEMIGNDVEISGVEDITEELGMDSIQIIQLVVEIEMKFDIQIRDEDMDIDLLSKFDKIIEMITRYLSEKSNTR